MVAAVAYADMPPGFHVVGSNRNGTVITRIEKAPFDSEPSAKETHPKIQLYRLSENHEAYVLFRTIEHVADSEPNLVIVTSHAEFVVAFDSSGEIGRGDSVVVVYSGDGKFLKRWSLAQILNQVDLASAPKSVSSTWWRNDVRIVSDIPPQVLVSGPKQRILNETAVGYRYLLDLKTLVWRKVK